MCSCARTFAAGKLLALWPPLPPQGTAQPGRQVLHQAGGAAEAEGTACAAGPEKAAGRRQRRAAAERAAWWEEEAPDGRQAADVGRWHVQFGMSHLATLQQPFCHRSAADICSLALHAAIVRRQIQLVGGAGILNPCHAIRRIEKIGWGVGAAGPTRQVLCCPRGALFVESVRREGKNQVDLGAHVWLCTMGPTRGGGKPHQGGGGELGM